MKKQIVLILSTLGLILVLFHKQPTEHSDFLGFDTILSLTGYGWEAKPALTETEGVITSMEEELSRTLPQSKVYELNHGNGQVMEVSSDITHLLRQSKKMYDFTSGIFDITMAPAADLWGFTQKESHIPNKEELEEVKTKIGMEHLHYTDHTAQLDPGSEIDFGGIAKGYALEKIQTVFRDHHLKGGLANLGGDILAYGKKSDGTAWNVGIRTPDSQKEEVLGSLLTTDHYILTSGGYERYFEENGKEYQHILNPKTASPAESDLKSATIVCDLGDNLGVTADALATSFIIMGKESAIQFWQNSSLDFDMILVSSSGHVYFTEGLKNNFTPNSNSGYQFSVIK